jgi:hypothetical protein
MSEQAREPFTDPRRLFADGARAKQAERARLASILAPEPEPEPADAALDELADEVAERIVERVRAAEPEQPTEAAARGGGFDGGARPGQPTRRVETHEQTLTRILRSRAADTGAAF